MNLRIGLIATLAGIIATSAQAQQFATVSLNAPHKTVGVASQILTFSGTVHIDVNRGYWSLRYYHLYLDGTNDTSKRLDAGNVSQSFLDWLALPFDHRVAGTHYEGDIFEINQEITDEPGNYWHIYGDINYAADFWLQAADGIQYQSNRVAYSVNVVPEPVTLATFGIAGIGMFARRRRNKK